MHYKSVAVFSFLILTYASLQYSEAYEVGEDNKSKEARTGWLFPEKFGNYSLTSCSGAPSCGTNLASYNGIWAKSNGAEQVLFPAIIIINCNVVLYFINNIIIIIIL